MHTGGIQWHYIVFSWLWFTNSQHSGTFWNILEHSGTFLTFLNILEHSWHSWHSWTFLTFWNILEHFGTFLLGCVFAAKNGIFKMEILILVLVSKIVLKLTFTISKKNLILFCYCLFFYQTTTSRNQILCNLSWYMWVREWDDQQLKYCLIYFVHIIM